MKTKPHHILAITVCLLCLAGVAVAQERTQKPQPLITKQKIIIGTLRINESQTIEVKSSAVFNVTSCRTDRTLAGELTIQLEEASRKMLEEKLEKPFLSAITIQNVIADFAKGSECPTLKLEFQPVSITINGATLRIDKFTLDLKESNQEVYRVLCYYVRCVIECRQVRRINQLLWGYSDN